MSLAFFVSDLHGDRRRYRTLFQLAAAERPSAVFLGGDLLPPASWGTVGARADDDFIGDVLAAGCVALADRLGASAPTVFLIPGNDDPRACEPALIHGEQCGFWRYAHARRITWDRWVVYGYACVPPTPFLLKDWERYDVSRHVPPGCTAPDEGWRTAPTQGRGEATIGEELSALLDPDQSHAIWLLHAPPYDTPLDRAALDGRSIDLAPLDVHVGSIAVRRLIQRHQPIVTLHGHVHEAARLTGTWHARLGRTCAFQAAHDGPELAVVRFDPGCPESATRTLHGTGET